MDKIIEVDDMVIVNRLVKKNEDEPVPTRVVWHLDFSNLTRTQELSIMASNISIRMQNKWRTGKVGDIAQIDVAIWMEDHSRKQGKSSEEKILNIADKMSQDEKERLIKQLEESME